MKLSVIVPELREPNLQEHVSSLLENSELGNELEVIVVHDGVDPVVDLVPDPRIVHLRLEKNSGMREAINRGVELAKGEFIMRTDAHCAFGKGYDRIMTSECQPNWIMTARRFFLDPTTWTVMDLPYVDYEKLVIVKDEQGNDVKFSGSPWKSRTAERKDVMVDETMAMQGSMWLMPKKWWVDVIGKLQTEGYGPAYQDSHEMIFKTWKAGGKMMLTKNTWFAHKHRSFPRSHNEGTKENPWIREESWTYALKVWKDYYLNEIVPKWSL